MIIGIDPGISGAIAVLHDDGSLAHVADMPLVSVTVAGKQRNRISGALLAMMFRSWQERAGRLHVVLEDVAAMPGNGAVSMFAFGHSKGIVEGIVACLGISMSLVRPAKWKKAVGLNSEKGNSRLMAMQLWPEHAGMFKLAKWDGRAEAALLALYGHTASARVAA